MSTQWSRLDRFRYWRKQAEVDMFVWLDETAEWSWEALRFHKQLAKRSEGYMNHRQAMRGADQWAATNLANGATT